jgi:AcrR family transcriptional regulator
MGITERKEREKEQRRNDIIDAAEKVFFEKGMELATMDDVAKEAELSKGTLYLYFNSKDDLLHAIIHRGLLIMKEMFTEAFNSKEIGLEKVSAVGDSYFEFSRKYPNYFRIMLLHKHPESHKPEDNPNLMACAEQGDRSLDVVAQAVEVGIEDGTIRSDVNPMEVAVILWAQSNGIVQTIFEQDLSECKGMDIPSEHIIKTARGLMLDMLRPRP